MRSIFSCFAVPFTYAFDANGNQQIVESPGGQRTTNSWGYENGLSAVAMPDGSRVTYT